MLAEESKPFAFVLMPFSHEFKDVYELGIKQVCRDLCVIVERVDEQQFDESILSRIYSQIDKADIILADMTGRNPNVFYEVGYAHGKRKRVILLTQKIEDIPYDLKHYPHIIYEGRIGDKLIPMLKEKLEWSIANPKKVRSTQDLLQEIEKLKNDVQLLDEIRSFRVDDN